MGVRTIGGGKADVRRVRIELVLAALKTEQLMVIGKLDGLRITLDEVAELVVWLSAPITFWAESIVVLLRECRPEILRQHPRLKEVPDPDAAGFDAWLAACRVFYGSAISLRPCP